MGNGSWSMQTISKCSNGDTCNSVSFECSSAPNYECDSATSPNSFVCHGVGLFPDPFICEKYHMCVPGEEDPSIPQETSIVLSCPSGYGYDVVTSSCRIKKEACPSAIICTNSTMKAFVKNPSFYYWCLKTSSSAYYPHIFMCPQGQHMINNRCQDPPTGILTSGYCLSPGNYADPSNCRAYNECPAKDVVAIKRICPNTQYFSYVSGKCVDFTCNSFIGK